MKIYGYVYKTINVLNNKIYIGQRLGEFDPSYLGSGKLLKRAIYKYGCNNFKVELLKYARNKKELNKLEKFYIAEIRRVFNKQMIYNIAPGGEGGDLLSGVITKCMYNPILNKDKRVPLKYVLTYLSNGWVKIRRASIGSNNPMYGNGYKLQGKLNGRYGKGKHIWMYNSITNKSCFVSKTDVSNYLMCGWIKGRNPGVMGDRVWVHNDILKQSKLINRSDLNIYLNTKWVVGLSNIHKAALRKPKKNRKCFNIHIHNN